MYLEFIFIPVNEAYESYAYSVMRKLAPIKNVCVNLNRAYKVSLREREEKCKMDDVNIIIIDEECVIQKEIIIKYSENNYKQQKQGLEEFVDLLKAFNESSDKDESWCIIM